MNIIKTLNYYKMDVEKNIIKSYLDEVGIVDCQINSYNDFILNRINSTIEEENKLSYEYEPGKFYKVELKNVFVDKPTHISEERVIRYITPNEARMRDLNYEGNICVDLYITTIEDDVIKSNKIIHRQPISKIPVMINSVSCNLYQQNKELRIKAGECVADPGGYFIINGKERVIIAQERKAYNSIYTTFKNDVYCSEIRSMSNETGHSVLLKIVYQNGKFSFLIPNIDKRIPIPIGVIFKCFGLSNEEIYELFKDTKYARHVVQNSHFVKDENDALKHVAQLSSHNVNEQDYLDYSTQIINYEMLPHISSYSKNYKILFLRDIIIKLMNTIDGVRPFDDRDNLAKKRIESTGILLAELFRTVYKNYIRKIQGDLKTDILNTLSKYYNVITKDIRLSFATGNWGSTRNNFVRNGVSQVLCRLSYNGMVSHLRRTNIQIGKEGKNSSIRQLHQSHIFFFCSAECFDPNTPILLANGYIKMAKDIVIGDMLIGGDGKITRVRKTCSGMKNMYEIKQNNGMNHIVTDNHILVLKYKNQGKIYHIKERDNYQLTYFDKKIKTPSFKTLKEAETFKQELDNGVIDIQLEDYLKLSEYTKSKLVGFKCEGVEWGKKEVELDPYLLGMWLGDGMKDGYMFSTADKELLDYWVEWGKNNDATIKHHIKYQYGISSTINNQQTHISIAANRSEKAPLKKLLEKYNLVQNKHIPKEYIINDRDTRLKVLAGLVDTDGSVRSHNKLNGEKHEIRISQCIKNKKVIDGAKFLAESLGFTCHLSNFKRTSKLGFESEYFELTITGEKLYEIPTILERKKLSKYTTEYSVNKIKSTLYSKISVKEIGMGDFVGFQLENNGRFLLGDFTVSHNTPEGQAVGIVKNLALTVSITNKIDSISVKDIIVGISGYNCINNYSIFDNYIFVNGELFGYINNDINSFLKKLYSLRNRLVIHPHISIIYNKYENRIDIFTDEGRLIRPIINVRKRHLLNPNSFEECLRNNSIVYRDASELEIEVIAMTPKKITEHTIYLEIHPCLMLGLVGNIIPFPDHNQAPRNVYYASMAKQVISLFANNFNQRVDTCAHVLHYPQLPIVDTEISKMSGIHDQAFGVNAIVAIMCYGG